MSKPNTSTVRFFDPSKDQPFADPVEDTRDLSVPGFPAPPPAYMDVPELNIELSEAQKQEILDKLEADKEEQIFSHYDAEQASFYGEDHIKGPESRVTAAISDANRLNRIEGTADLNIGGGGSLGIDLRQVRETKNQEEFRQKLSEAREDIDKQQKEEREKVEEKARSEAWHASSHTYAGQTMDSEEWMRLIDWFKKPENEAAWEDAMMQETGQTREQVRTTKDKLKRLHELIELEAAGKKLTAEEKEELRILNQDKDVKIGISVEKKIESGTIRPANQLEETAFNGETHTERSQARMSLVASDIDTTDEIKPTSIQGVEIASISKNAINEITQQSEASNSGIIAARAGFNADPITPVFNPIASAQILEPEIVPISQAPRQQVAAAMNADLDMG